MNSRNAEVKITRFPLDAELCINDNFVANWDIAQDTPGNRVSLKLAESIAYEAYKSGYDAAKKDLKEWIEK